MGSIRSIDERVKRIAQNADLRQRNTAEGEIIPLRDNKPLETNTGRLQVIANNNEKLRQQSRAIMAEYSENRRRADNMRAEIAKGARDGADILTLLDKAVYCISCMTGDTAFYISTMSYIKER